MGDGADGEGGGSWVGVGDVSKKAVTFGWFGEELFRD